MERSGFRIAGDVHHQRHEDSKIPSLCESCLGDNPYVRMIRETSGKECKICARPYTSFRWKPGPQARYKQTIICQSCSRLKNVCQTCLFDLEYGLPVQVRDKFLDDHQKLELPNSYVNRNYLASQIDKLCEDLPYGKSSTTHEGLMKLARIQPYYRRNRPRVCSFWLKGTCNRGTECPFLHTEEEHDPSLANQNIRDRFTGTDDPVAQKILKRAQDSALQADSFQEDNSYLTTIYAGNIKNNVGETIIRDHFRPFGEIKSIKMIPKQDCAFITYANHESARNAMETLSDNLMINKDHVKLSLTTQNRTQSSSIMDPNHNTNFNNKATIHSQMGNTFSNIFEHLPRNTINDKAQLTHPNYISQHHNINTRSVYSSMSPSEAEHRK